MSLSPQSLIDALENRLAGAETAQLIQELRELSPEGIREVIEGARIRIAGDGNIIGSNNLNIVVKGAAATELAGIVHSALERRPLPYQLRAPIQDFIGRDNEIPIAVNSLRSGENACINGMAGAGKTELSYRVAFDLRDDYPAQLLLDLRGTHENPLAPGDALASCIRAFEGPEAKLPNAVDELEKLYRSILNGKRALVMLENIFDASQIRPLLPPEGSVLLITSRNALAVPGLKVISIGQFSAESARELLLTIAPHLTPDVADEISALCGNLPLAIRAAGSLLAVTIDLDPAEYAAQLRDERTRLERIGTEGVDIGVEASFNLSYARLQPKAAQVFRQLAVFPATFDGSAEEEVCRDRSHSFLSNLVKRSLVQYDRKTRRYSLHDLMRLFAIKHLEAKGVEGIEAAKRHAKHYIGILKRSDELYRRGGQAARTALPAFDSEWENIHAGQAWAAKYTGKDEEALTLCVEYPNAGASLLELRQSPRERIRWLEAALEAAKKFNDPNIEIAQLNNLGMAYVDSGNIQHALELFERALAIVRKTGEALDAVLGNLGMAYNALGEYKRAIHYYEKALSIQRRNGDLAGVKTTFNNIGAAYSNMGNSGKAVEMFEHARVLSKRLGDFQGEAQALTNLGLAYTYLDESNKAIESYQQALEICREIGDRRGECAALINLSLAHFYLEEYELAIEFSEQSLGLSRKLEDLNSEAHSQHNMGLIYAAKGETQRAIEHFNQALNIFDKIGDRHGKAAALGGIGSAYSALNEPRRAIEYYKQALTIDRQIGTRRGEGIVLFNMSSAFKELGELDKSISYAEDALKIFEELKDPHAIPVRKYLNMWRDRN